MNKRTRRRHTAEQKAEALKRHYLQKQEVSTICEDLKLNPSLFFIGWYFAFWESHRARRAAYGARAIGSRPMARRPRFRSRAG